MKNAILLTLVIVIGLAFNAHALPLWPGEDPTWTTADSFDRSKEINDEYDSDYHGYTSDDYTGFYIGTIEGNTEGEGDDLMYQAIAHYLEYPPTNLEREKVDDIDDINDTSYTGNYLTVIWENSLKSGSWELSSDDTHNYKMNFYAVKGANEFALYYVHPSLSKGTWTTRHLSTPQNNNNGKIPEISHFNAAYTNPGLESVPEPASMLLFGTGLIGLAWVGRRQLQGRKDA